MGGLRKRFERALSFLVPGDLHTQTGGYVFDRRILEQLRRAGWHSEIHSLDPSFPMPSAKAIRNAGEVLQRLPAGRIVVIDGLAMAGIAGSLAARPALCPVALIHHPLALETGLDPHTAALMRRAEAQSLAYMRGVIVTSKWTARELDGYGVQPGRIRVVTPGVDAVDNRERVSATSSRLNLLCVATLTPRKGHDVLFHALARLKDRDWRLCCAGSDIRDPETASGLRCLLRDLQLESRIRLAGELDEAALQDEYRRCDAFVLASYLEGYGMVLADAISHGLPVISTRAGAIPETVPETASILVTPGDSGALATALASIMDDRGMLNRLSSGARSARAFLPTWEQAGKNFASALQHAACFPS